MKVMVIAPHMDDEVLGMGGTIAKHVANGDEVYVCIVANRAYNHLYEDEWIKEEKQAALAAKDVLGYKEVKFLDLKDEQLDHKLIEVLVPIEEYLSQTNPDVVYVNHRGDPHQDHRAVFDASIIACRTVSKPGIKKLICYEIPSATEFSPPFAEFSFLPNYYVNIESFLETKIKALKCYRREARDFPNPRSLEGVRILAKKRGMEIGFEAAEAFVIIRSEWN